MNNNAFNKKSTIKVKETNTGGIHSSVGFPGNMGGEPISLEKNLEILESNGFNVEKTDKGILIDKHPKL